MEGCFDGVAPAEIWFERPAGDGPTGTWVPPSWLETYARRWARQPVTLGVMATEGGAVCEAVFQCLSELGGVAPGWQLVLRTDGTGLTSMSMIHRVLSGPFDEVQFCCGTANGRPDGRTQRVLMVIKQLIELRQARHQDRPEVTWLCETNGSSDTDDAALRALRSTARQLGVDRFEIVTPTAAL